MVVKETNNFTQEEIIRNLNVSIFCPYFNQAISNNAILH